MDLGGQPSRSAAQRRRGRRLRAALRHERQSTAMVLAEFSHHSSGGQRMARAGGWVREEVYGTSFSTTTSHLPSRVRGLTVSPTSGPQERVPRRIVEQIVDSAPVVPLLHAPEPQLVDSVMEVRKILNLLPHVEQVIEVPKILQHTVLQRSSLQEPQMAEQLGAVLRDRARQGGARLGSMQPRLHAYFGVRAPRGRVRHWMERHRQARAVFKYWP